MGIISLIEYVPFWTLGGNIITGTVAVTLDNVTCTASGTESQANGPTRLLSVSLSMEMSEPLSIG